MNVPPYILAVLGIACDMRHKTSALVRVLHREGCGFFRDEECDCRPKIEIEQFEGEMEAMADELRRRDGVGGEAQS